jgi:hypothetical protein
MTRGGRVWIWSGSEDSGHPGGGVLEEGSATRVHTIRGHSKKSLKKGCGDPCARAQLGMLGHACFKSEWVQDWRGVEEGIVTSGIT